MLVIFVALNVLFLSQCVCEGKSDPKFRTSKINYIWDKVSVHIKDSQVATKLQKDLANFDQLYLTIKQDTEHHKKTKNLSEVDAKLETLLRRYDLEETIHAFKMKYKNDELKVNVGQEPTSKNVMDTKFADERVIELWELAKNDADFTNDDIEELHRQLIQQDNRCHDYQELLKHHKQTSDNHIHSHDEHEEISQQVKQLNQKIEDTFEQLRNRITELKDNPFTNTKVRQLWDKARKSHRLIPNELDVIKTELRHLDRQWDKVEYHKEHLTEHEDTLKSMGAHDGNDERTQSLREHQDKLKRKLKKLEAYLEDKLIKHSEL